MFSKKDLRDIRSRGIAPEEVLRQIRIFKKGFSFVNLIRPCRAGEGIRRLDEKDISRLTAVYSKAQSAGRAMKFVPASGAATRMFKDLMSANGLTDNESLTAFTKNIKSFPFYEALRDIMSKNDIDIEKALREGAYRDIIDYALYKKGLNLAGLPKALISFHRYSGYSRTPLEEHLVEAGDCVTDANGKAHIHFTVSTEHEEAIRSHVNSVKGRYEHPGLKFEIHFSNQKPSTDTIAVNMDNTLFRDKDGGLVFRPGGHGALLENLNDLKGQIIFIKNIDNVAPDRLKAESTIYKRALAGCLVELQEKIFGYLKGMENSNNDEDLLSEISAFIRDSLSISPPDGMEGRPYNQRRQFLFDLLNRPLRVCGMVKNQAEPGGGPFWVKHHDGSISLQIVEKSQVNMESEDQRIILESSTHFNPVDLVCGVMDYRGKIFDLKKFVDPETYFISVKSHEGRDLKALELPGLWNGAMAFWNTVFIEVPLITFNPVKTVFDLLRDEHQLEAK
ncbi:MAG: DUF4301 family protein [Deltaproteobacteria bacterium]|nr:DUF4301 family protein [Deltaproteobacteria bacterium]